MKIVSIYTGHNATIGYFEDGECKLILHEEKFNNIKNFFGFPELALSYMSRQVKFSDIDYFSFGQKYLMMGQVPTQKEDYFESKSRGSLRVFYDYLDYKTGLKDIFKSIRNHLLNKRINQKAWHELHAWFKDKHKVDKNKIITYDHHFTHCVTPVYFYGLNEKIANHFLLLSMDGVGDNSFSKVCTYDASLQDFKIIASSSLISSIGLLYSEMTRFLGMKPHVHEYKVMGLAAYASNTKYYQHIYDRLSELVWLNEDTLEFNSAINTNVAGFFFKKHFSFERFDNLSAAIQKLTEDLVVKWIRAAIKKTGIDVIAVSGGVFMNVKMNQKILSLPEVKKIYFQPSCGDESITIGAAGNTFIDKGINLKPINTMFLGHAYSADKVRTFLEKNGYFQKYHIEYFEDIETKIGLLLAEFKIVARFRGNGEWGARSLCNRGILGNPSDLRTFYDVNDMIKMRDFWMPFAPTILEEWAERYIKNWERIKKKAFDSMRFMIVTCDSTELAQKHLRAAMHQKDKTLRPNIVSNDENPKLYRLLKSYEKVTGMGGILNTSLNLHGYPIVGTLEQAMFTLQNSGLNYLALEDWLISKR